MKMSLRKGIFDDPTTPEPLWEGSVGLVPVIDVARLYIEIDIVDVQENLLKLRDTESHLKDRVFDYGRALDEALHQELAEYKKLENELAEKEGKDKPFEDAPSQKEQVDDAIKKAKEREASEEYVPTGGVDPKVHKLYKKYAKIYHPDKASAEDKEYFTEVFQMLNHYKILNDYRGLKEFCKKLRKKTKAEVVTAIEDLKTFLKELREEEAALKRKCISLIEDPLQERADDYFANPAEHILGARANINSKIERLRKRIKGRPKPRSILWS